MTPSAGLRAAALLAAMMTAALPRQVQCAEPACLPYEQPSEIEGRLRLAVLPGPPHYRSFEEGDQPEQVWLLSPTIPACTQAVDGDLWNVALQDITTIRAVPRAPFDLNWNGRRVRVAGSFFRPHGAHARAALAVRATQVTPLAD